MFNLRRFLGYWIRVIAVTGFFFGSLFLLGFLTAPWINEPPPSIGHPAWFLVLLNTLPGLLAIIMAFYLPSRFLQSLYELKSLKEGFKYLIRSEFGRPSFRPLVIIDKGPTIRGDDTVNKIGGPGGVLVFDGSAVVLERAGKLTRVLTPGVHELKPFERVWEAVDLQEHRWEYSVGAMTLEGIPVTCMADIRFKIRDDGKTPTSEEPYPTTEEAVLDAVFCKWIRDHDRSEPDRRMEWDKRVIISHTEGTLRSILSLYPLDQLIQPERRRAIRSELEEALKESVAGLGAKIISVELGDITLEDEATQQWIEAWQATKHRAAETIIAKGEAEKTQLEVEAQIDVKLDMLQSTANVLKILNKRYGSKIPPRVIALRFTDMIREIPGNALYLPDDVVATLEEIENRF